MKRHTVQALLTAASLGLLLSACEPGMKEWSQTGYRGAGLQQVADVSSKAKQAAIPAPPYALEASMRQGERATAAYQNVKVLTDLSTEEFNHFMASMTLWVAPGDAEGQGCNYCHNPENMASDEKYTKIVARKMIQMTRNINNDWTSHVQATGVTCWTCHRGNNVPVNKWAMITSGDQKGALLRGNKHGQNTPDENVGYASLPSNAFAEYFQGNAKNIRVAASSPYPSADHQVSLKTAEHSYGLMMHLSQSLGVNCTYCHNSQSFRAWNLSRAQRGTAWYGIRMVRNTNSDYILPLAGVFPANRKGPLGDPYKVNCLTCHQGVSKPLGGVSMLPDYPYLRNGAYRPHLAGGTPDSANAMTAAYHEPGAMTGGPATTSPVQAVPTGAGATSEVVDNLPQLNVYFDTGKSAVAPQVAERASGVIGAAKADPKARLVISGFNDATGNAAANAELSKNRAKAVAAALKAAGVPEAQIVLEKPADTTGTGDTNADARRVEVTVRK